MQPRFVGQRVARRNDEYLLRGTGRYLDDIVLPGMVHASVVRSPVAHGRLIGFDGADSAQAVVYGPDRLASLIPGELPVLWILGDQQQHSTPVVDNVLRFVGQP
ncbi:MAG: xanthine dehydrogenase family protein molybdopterin-binding subunit, partial [bacterium]|nr:xanthine dehydrogenase family protein molybdopterin-binding subunit [bacterium]